MLSEMYNWFTEGFDTKDLQEAKGLLEDLSMGEPWELYPQGRERNDMHLTFEWDEEKARTNLRKHRVSFDEAKSLFNDPFLLTFPDPEHLCLLRLGTLVLGSLLKDVFLW